MDCMSKHSNRYTGSPLCGDSAANAAGLGAGVIRTGQYGYAHVWELQQLKGSNSSPDVIDMEHRDSGVSGGGLCGDPLVIYERGPMGGANTTRVMHGPRTKDCPTYESSVPAVQNATVSSGVDETHFYSDYDPTQQSPLLHVVGMCQHQMQYQQCSDCRNLEKNSSPSVIRQT